MSAPNSDWGDMVIPGVYMIQRTTHVDRTQKIINSDGQINLELVHLEMEELAKDIVRLTKSNEEIVYYLSHKEEYKDDDEKDDDDGGDCSMAAMIATTAGEVEEEDDDEVFRDALQENEGVIKRKEAELALLRALVADQKCGCHAHENVAPLAVDPATASPVVDAAPPGTIAQTETEEVPTNRIVL